ncbi:bifunctional folylpolyglutamate synthase/dihydrofolate synthase [Sphingomonas sp. RS6]
MPDFARSTDPAVQAQLDRLTLLSPGADILGLDRITRLLERVGNPHLRLPPVLHVAGTNGKGSTCAFLRAALEAAGLRVHVYSSPHLVRFNERIRLAGRLIDDAVLAPLLAEVLDAGGDIGASFFEVTTAAAFLAFARTPADACVIEVGLGGRLDATNVIPAPIVTGIAQLGIDHQAFLGDTLPQIAGEKAGIAKPGVPMVTMRYEPEIANVISRTGAPILAQGTAWDIAEEGGRLVYRDGQGSIEMPMPSMAGPHQPGNLGLAVAMLRHQKALAIPNAAFATAATETTWPARMQRLQAGPLAAMAPAAATIWLDGGHNPAAGAAIAGTLAALSDAPAPSCHLVIGMLANKDPTGLLQPLVPQLASVTALPVPGHDHHAPAALAALAESLGVRTTAMAADVPAALRGIADRTPNASTILILGSLYLAGTVLEANRQLPD